MTHKQMKMARIYLNEGSAHLDKLITLLKDVEHVKGATIYRGIEGFGESGEIRSASLVDLSQNLPITVEFYDEVDKVNDIIEHLGNNIKPGHIVSWPVDVQI